MDTGLGSACCHFYFQSVGTFISPDGGAAGFDRRSQYKYEKASTTADLVHKLMAG
jgi:hypothetical protein